MKKYYCECCKHQSSQSSNYKKHLSSKKHKTLVEITPELPLITPELPLITPELPLITPKFQIICKYCNKIFKHTSGLSRHIKYTCKKNNDEDLVELVRLLNEKTKSLQNQNENMQNQIDKLSQKLQMQNVNNHNNLHSHNKYDIKILNYNNTDYEHLTEKDYLKCFQENNHCVKQLIEKVHFTKENPENHNIYISNIKNNYVMVYSDCQWTLTDRTKQITDLYDKNEYELETWYDNYKEKYPDIMKSFTRYLKNKEEDNDLLNDIKDQVILMLYNKRNVVL